MRIIFDATFGEGWVEALRSFFQIHKEPRPLFLHIYHMFDRNVKDNEWIPKVVGQDCLIITADTGRMAPRLPLLCKQYKKTYILISPTMHNKCNQFQKARAIIVLWPEIVNTMEHPRGSCFQIQPIPIDGVYERFRLVKKQIKKGKETKPVP